MKTYLNTVLCILFNLKCLGWSCPTSVKPSLHDQSLLVSANLVSVAFKWHMLQDMNVIDHYYSEYVQAKVIFSYLCLFALFSFLYYTNHEPHNFKFSALLVSSYRPQGLTVVLTLKTWRQLFTTCTVCTLPLLSWQQGFRWEGKVFSFPKCVREKWSY